MTLEINYKKEKKTQHMEVKEYATEQTLGHRRNQREKKNLETNKHGNTMIPYLWDAAKAL